MDPFIGERGEFLIGANISGLIQLKIFQIEPKYTDLAQRLQTAFFDQYVLGVFISKVREDCSQVLDRKFGGFFFP